MRIILLLIIGTYLLPNIGFAQTFTLNDSTSINAKILSFYEEKFVVQLKDGSKRIIPKDTVVKIEFEKTSISKAKVEENLKTALKGNPNFSSPIKTFLYWKKAAIKGNLAQMAECFVFPSKEDQLLQLKGLSKQQIKKMKKETKKTNFLLSNPLIDGAQAYLSVTREFKGSSSKQIIEFQKEGSNWKMIPN